MIFVTIGTQEPFDRLVKAMDSITPSLNTRVIAQVAHTAHKVQHMEAYDFLNPSAFNAFFSQAHLIVSHAGMGTIISALVQEKPILIMPRLAQYGEHRNDHQMATAIAFEKLKYVHVSYNENELENKLKLLLVENAKHLHKLGNCASDELILSLRSYITTQTSA